MRHVLAIDLGTSGLKVALVSERGEVVASTVRPVVTQLLPDSGAEQDPEEIWAALVDAAREVTGTAGRDSIVAIACDSQYSSIIPVDAEGRATTNLLVWMD